MGDGDHVMEPNELNSRNKSSQLMQFLGAATACILAFSSGCVLGWTSPAGPLLVHGDLGFNVTVNQNSWIVSLMPIGAAISCVPAGYLTDHIGRKYTLLCIVPIFLLGWSFIIWATSVGMIYFGRFVCGICAGAVCVVAPAFTSEICEKRIRGALGSFYQLLLAGGICFSYVVGCFVDVYWLSISCAIFPIVFGCLFLFFPDTPIFYLSQNNTEKAQESLLFYRGPNYDTSSELTELTKAVQVSTQYEPLLKAFQSKQAVSSMRIAVGLMVFQQLSGINAVVFYTTTIFQDAGSSLKAEHATIITGFMQVFATLFMTFLVERLGRRILLITSALVMAICAILVGLYFHLKTTNFDTTSIRWLPLVSLCVYIIMFSIGLGPIPWVLIPEILPSRIRGVAASMAAVLNWFCAFLVTKLFPNFVLLFGAAITYWLFAAVNLVSAGFCWFVIETKGKSFQEIQDELGR